MTAHRQGKWQRLAEELKLSPNVRVHVGDRIHTSAIQAMRALGIEVEATVSVRRGTEGSSADRYSVYAWWPTPETQLDMVELQLANERNHLALARAQLADIETDLDRLNKRKHSLQIARAKAMREVTAALRAVDTSTALRAKYIKELGPKP